MGWLGEGIYFWEHGPGRAMSWAEARAKRFGGQPAVVGAIIQLADVFDLTDIRFSPLLRATYDRVSANYAAQGLFRPTGN